MVIRTLGGLEIMLVNNSIKNIYVYLTLQRLITRRQCFKVLGNFFQYGILYSGKLFQYQLETK